MVQFRERRYIARSDGERAARAALSVTSTPIIPPPHLGHRSRAFPLLRPTEGSLSALQPRCFVDRRRRLVSLPNPPTTASRRLSQASYSGGRISRIGSPLPEL